MSDFYATAQLAIYDGTPNASGTIFDQNTIKDWPESLPIYSDNSFALKKGEPDPTKLLGLIMSPSIDENGVVTGGINSATMARIQSHFPKGDVYLCGGALVENHAGKPATQGIMMGFFCAPIHVDKRIKPLVDRGEKVQTVHYHAIPEYDTVCKCISDDKVIEFDFIGEEWVEPEDQKDYVDAKLHILEQCGWKRDSTVRKSEHVPLNYDKYKFIKNIDGEDYGVQVGATGKRIMVYIWRIKGE